MHEGIKEENDDSNILSTYMSYQNRAELANESCKFPPLPNTISYLFCS